MDMWEQHKLVLFILFFLPGFISLKVYDLFVPGEIRKAADSLIEAIAYSCINYAIFIWLIYLDSHFNWANHYPFFHILFLLLLLLISPICLSLGFYYLRIFHFSVDLYAILLPNLGIMFFRKGKLIG